MFDWLGSLELKEQAQTRAVFGLSKGTRTAGAVLFAVGFYFAARAFPVTPWLALVPALLSLLGLVLVTLRRRVVVDKEAGIMTVFQSAFGIGNEIKFPLFHLRAVVIVARPKRASDALAFLPGSARFVAYFDRRVGEVVFLDESARCANLLRMAELIADVAGVRLEYEAPTSATSFTA